MANEADLLKHIKLPESEYERFLRVRARRKLRNPFVLPGGKSIGVRLRELRTKYELPLRVAGELAGVQLVTYRKFECLPAEAYPNFRLATIARYAEAVGGRLRIAILDAGSPRRVDYHAKLRVWRDAQRPNPKTVVGARIQALSKRRSPRKRVLRPRYP
jgi:hypothetical protein